MRILIAEDDNITRLILEKLLEKEGHQVVCANNGKEALKIFKAEDFDMVIIDWLMPEMDGLELCKRIREAKLDRYVYILFVTIKEKSEDIVKALNMGADDYLTKPFDPHELVSRINSGARVVELDKKLRDAKNRFERLSLTDELTGVLNRRGVIRRFEEELNRAKREGNGLLVIMLDIDNFKEINDRFGHCIGDEVLKEAAARIKSYMRSYDILGRYGGDEFLIVINMPKENIHPKIVEKFFHAICSKPFYIEGKRIEITASVGVNLVKEPKGDVLELIRVADHCLLKAKRKGKNEMVVAQT